MIRYGITYKAKDSLRTLFSARHLKATPEEAQATLDDFLRESADRMVQVCGEQSRGTFRVDPIDCWDHGDPKGIYVDD